MSAPEDFQELQSSESLPNSRKVYVAGKQHAALRVPFREISLAPTKSMNGEIEVNEAVRVYDTSGSWGDPDFRGDVYQGLPALQEKWIRGRGDVEEIEGRKIQPIDDGFLSDRHAASAADRKRSTLNPPAPEATARQTPNGGNGSSSFVIRHSSFAARKPLRARSGTAVTQLAYARRGIITPEMEFIAIRENSGLSTINSQPSTERNALGLAYAGSEPIENRKSKI